MTYGVPTVTERKAQKGFEEEERGKGFIAEKKRFIARRASPR